MELSSRGLGHRPFTAGTGVRIPLALPKFGEEASMVMHWTVNPALNSTTGSIPVFSTKVKGALADRLRQWIANPSLLTRWVGSIPTCSAKFDSKWCYCYDKKSVGGSSSGKTTDFDSVMHRFDPYTPCQNFVKRRVQMDSGKISGTLAQSVEQ